jgi:exonuclease VII large subunit
MKESFLIWISTIFCVAGIISLFLLNKHTKPTHLKISELREEMDFVKIVGTIERKYVSKTGTVFLTVRDQSGKIKAVIFKGVANHYGIKRGDEVEITGDVQTYRGELEIIVKKIRAI